MRLVSAVLFVALTGALTAGSVLAQDAKPADPKPEVASDVTKATKKKVPYRVVKMLPETGQVLLFDRIHASHVVAEVGQSLDGYLVEDIDDEEVTLVAENGAQVILTAPAPLRPAKRVAKKPASDAAPADAPDAVSASDAAPAPVDPYAEPSEVADPGIAYAESAAPKTPGEGGVRVASAPDASAGSPTASSGSPTASSGSPSASSGSPTVSPAPAAPIVDSGASEPSDPYADPGIAAFVDAVGAAQAPTPDGTPTVAPEPAKPPATTSPSAKAKTAKSKAGPSTAAPATAPAEPDAASALAAAATGTKASPAVGKVGAAPAGTAPAGTTATLARAELDGALADFSKLAGSFRASFTPDGLRFDAINEGTLLTRIGLRRSDLITYVDGQPLRSLDDAANLYARASTVKHTTIQVVRDGKLVTLRVAIQ